MIQRILARIILTPFSWIYGALISSRNALYDTKILKSSKFNIPIIGVGNLTVGGAGKSPHVEYLIKLLKDYIQVAVLSRGYGRKTRGFLFVKPNNTALQIGDEPLQFKRKHPEITVAVAESRALGIPNIMLDHPHTQTIILDDAYQHRSVTPSINILLTEYDYPFVEDYLLPAGRLREWRKAYHRADVIIVSKCPPELAEEEKTKWFTKLNILPHQKLFFSYYQYNNPYYIFNQNVKIDIGKVENVVLLSGIARTEYLMTYLEEKSNFVKAINYEDHHIFKQEDLDYIRDVMKHLDRENPIIITTEKDAIRLEPFRDYIIENNLLIFVLPIEVKFHFDQGPQFDKIIKDYLLNYKI